MNNYVKRSTKPLSQYPLLVILSAFVCGIILQQTLRGITATIWALSAFLFFIVATILLLRPDLRRQIQIARMIVMILTFALLGATVSSTSDISNHRSWYGNFLNSSEALKLKVTDVPVERSKTILIPVSVEGFYTSGRWMEAEGAIGLYIYRKNFNTSYQPGQILIIPNKLVAIKNSGNPFSFDLARMYNRKGIVHQAFLSAHEVCLASEYKEKPSALGKLKQKLQYSIDQNVADSTTRSLIAATLLNERSNLDHDLMAAYSNTGIIHIIAISGMHIVLLAGFILWLLQVIPSIKLKAIKYVIAIIIVWLYIALTGFPPSAVRAAVMFTLLAIGISFNRTTNPVNTWAAAGLIVLCYNPYWLYDVGIQLSFLAVLSILLFYSPVRKWFAPKHKPGIWLWEVTAVSIAAQILVFPLVIYYFQQFPLLGILANVPAALYSTLLMFGALVMFVINAIGLPAAWLGTLLTLLTDVFNYIIIFLSDWTPQIMRSIKIDIFGYWLMMGVVVSCCIGCMLKKGGYLISGLLLCLVFVSDLIIQDVAALKQQRLIVYNINKISQADLLLSTTAVHLFPPDSGEIKYTLKPAMMGYRINSEIKDTVTGTRLLKLKSASVLFLERCSINTETAFPVDYLVVSNHCVFNPQQWFQAFHPKKIILDGSIPRWKAIKWKKELTNAGARVHWVQEDGAWQYP